MTSAARIGIIGGGIAGSTIALYLAQQGLTIELFEQGSSLVNGPPVCHLHAGGNFYREISDQQCRELLLHSLHTMQLYPQAVNPRPTLIVHPCSDPGEPLQLLPRLKMLRSYYQDLIAADPSLKLLGEPAQYFQLFERAELQQLAQQPLPQQIQQPSDWLIPVAKELQFDQLKFPLVLVQEYGLSLFRVAATAQLTLERLSNVQLHLNTPVEQIQALAPGWQVRSGQQDFKLDYLINAAGFRSGQIDDLLLERPARWVEFKAAYLAHWPECQGLWPELIFHGPRGSHNGMAQLTPYGEGLFQLHGMTPDITLFPKGLVANKPDSAQPQLPRALLQKIEQGWPNELVQSRSHKAIAHLAQHLPNFAAAQPAGKPLFGAQQIPGPDPSLRAAQVSFGQGFARAEIVKSSSAIYAAQSIFTQLCQLGLAQGPAKAAKLSSQLSLSEVEALALKLSQERQYPEQLARKTGQSWATALDKD